MLEVDNVYHYREEEIVFDRLSLFIGASEKVLLIGPHGAGKSLLLQILCGYILPSKGLVRIQSFDIQFDGKKARQHLGYVPSQSTLDPSWTVGEALHLFAEMRGLAAAANHAVRIADRWQLDEVFGERVGELSHGQRMRVLMAAATVHDPALLLLDDPLLRLDPWETRLLFETLDREWKSCAILMATHRVEAIPSWFQRGLLLHDGQIVKDCHLSEEGALQALLNTPPPKAQDDDSFDIYA